MFATKRTALRYLAIQRYDIVHSPDGVELGVMPTLAEDLEAAWLIARQSFPQQHVMVLAVVEDD
jgi:hypothetical protein